MINKKLISGLSLLCLASQSGWCQHNIPMKSWRSHFNFEQTFLVEEVNNKIYAAASAGLTFYDAEDKSLNSVTKIDGLSEVVASSLTFDNSSQQLAIGYDNGNLDIVSDKGIRNIRDIVDSDVSENKRINAVQFYRDFLLIVIERSVILYDLQDNRVADAFKNLGQNGARLDLHDAIVNDDHLFLATEKGVICADLSSGANLSDFNFWERYTATVVNNQDIVSISISGASIYASTTSKLFRLTEGMWQEVTLNLAIEEEISGLRSSRDKLLIITNQGLKVVNIDQSIFTLSLPAGEQPMDALISSVGDYWYADAKNGLTRLENDQAVRFVLNGPGSDIHEVKYAANTMYALNSSAEINDPAYTYFSNGGWQAVKKVDIGIAENVTAIWNDGSDLWIGTEQGQLINTTENKSYDHSNSTLPSDIPITAIKSRQNGSIWVSTHGSNVLHQLNNEGTWSAFSSKLIGSGQSSHLDIDPQGNIWLVIQNVGLLGINVETGNERLITTDNSSLPSDQINEIAIDRNGAIWIATQAGIAYFPFSSGIINDPTIDVVLPVFEDAFLFEEKAVNAIAVDPGDRLWIGTEAGAWLFQAGLSSLVQKFDALNSPLPATNVDDISIDPLSGEVFFLTNQGMVSYRSDAILGSRKHQKIEIYPNPVSPDYQGWVGIKGLTNDAILKITTVSGRLVREVRGSGGAASWDVKDLNGRRVNTGVYLVFSASQDGTETYVGKIAIIN